MRTHGIQQGISQENFLSHSMTTCPIQRLATLLLLLCVFTTNGNAWAAKSNPTLPNLTALNSHDLKNQLVKPGIKASIVVLWASWNEPSKREVLELIKLRADKSNKKMQLFLIASDTENDLPEATEFLGKQNVGFPAYRLTEPTDAFMKAFADDWPNLVPTTLLFDQKGKLVSKWYGRFNFEKLVQHMKILLQGPSKGPVATKAKVRSH